MLTTVFCICWSPSKSLYSNRNSLHSFNLKVAHSQPWFQFSGLRRGRFQVQCTVFLHVPGLSLSLGNWNGLSCSIVETLCGPTKQAIRDWTDWGGHFWVRVPVWELVAMCAYHPLDQVQIQQNQFTNCLMKYSFFYMCGLFGSNKKLYYNWKWFIFFYNNSVLTATASSATKDKDVFFKWRGGGQLVAPIKFVSDIKL